MVLTFKKIHYRLGQNWTRSDSGHEQRLAQWVSLCGQPPGARFLEHPASDGRPARGTAADGPALARWLVAAGLVSPSQSARLQRRWSGAGTSGALEKLRDLRERCRREVIAIEMGGQPSAEFVREINRLLLGFPFVNQLVPGEPGLERRKWFAADFLNCPGKDGARFSGFARGFQLRQLFADPPVFLCYRPVVCHPGAFPLLAIHKITPCYGGYRGIESEIDRRPRADFGTSHEWAQDL